MNEFENELETLRNTIERLKVELDQSLNREIQLRTQLRELIDKYEKPKHSGRARCTYYGKSTGTGYLSSECDYCQTICAHEVVSNPQLPFFEEQADKEFDKFYCGCHSWN